MRKLEMFFVGVIFLVVVVLAVSFVSAGIGDWFKQITGKATSEQTNVSITITGTNAVTVTVFNGTLTGVTVDPTADGESGIPFVVMLDDADGFNDINTTSVTANFSLSGVLRQNTSCIENSGETTSTSRNFTCTINMQYFDTPGTWTIMAGGTDLGNQTFVYNTSQVFEYDTLQYITISPTSLTWTSAAPGATNQTSNNDPTLINNSGNYNWTNISVKAIDLYGDADSSYFIGVGNMSASNDTSGANTECDFSSAIATTLVNGTSTQINNTILSRGNHSVSDGQTGQEQIYYCFRTIPSSLSSQAYSTTTAGGWTITAVS